jgi:hypothetical protein
MTEAQVEDLVAQFDATAAKARGLFDALPAARLTHRPRADAWSAAECVVHLGLSNAACAPLVEDALASLRARNRRRTGPSQMDWLGRLLWWSIEPPSRFKVKTTAPFQPLRVEPLSEVLPAFLAQHDRIVRALRTTEGLDLQAVKIVSPFNARIRYRAYSTFVILVAHERRHLWQAEEAIRTAS